MRAEASQFYNDCFVPARSKYLRDKPTSAAITALLNEYGADDPDWMGSHGVSPALLPQHAVCVPVTGWPYDASKDLTTAPPRPTAGPAHLRRMVAGRRHDDRDRDKIMALPEASDFSNTLRERRYAISTFGSWEDRGHRGGEPPIRPCATTEQFARRGHDRLPA